MSAIPRYQPFYCEENIWHLAFERLNAPGPQTDVSAEDYIVVISNEPRNVALWSQRAASQTGEPVVWDYHVVLLDAEPLTPVIWDPDSILQTPAPLPGWWRGTFPLEDVCPDHLQPTFRVIDANVFLDHFSSDRSHMLTDGVDGDWIKPPPPWNPIFDPAIGMNLPDFVDVHHDFLGESMSRTQFKRAFHPQTFDSR